MRATRLYRGRVPSIFNKQEWVCFGKTTLFGAIYEYGSFANTIKRGESVGLIITIDSVQTVSMIYGYMICMSE